MEDAGKIKLVADVALFAGDRVLLVAYRDTRAYDGQGGWFLPDDHLRRLEHPEDGALRILREQLGIDLPSLDLRFIESFEGSGAWHLVFHFAGTLDREPKVVPGANTAKAAWFGGDEMPPREEMAHGGWALDVLSAIGKGRDEASHVRSVVD